MLFVIALTLLTQLYCEPGGEMSAISLIVRVWHEPVIVPIMPCWPIFSDKLSYEIPLFRAEQVKMTEQRWVFDSCPCQQI